MAPFSDHFLIFGAMLIFCQFLEGPRCTNACKTHTKINIFRKWPSAILATPLLHLPNSLFKEYQGRCNGPRLNGASRHPPASWKIFRDCARAPLAKLFQSSSSRPKLDASWNPSWPQDGPSWAQDGVQGRQDELRKAPGCTS